MLTRWFASTRLYEGINQRRCNYFIIPSHNESSKFILKFSTRTTNWGQHLSAPSAQDEIHQSEILKLWPWTNRKKPWGCVMIGEGVCALRLTYLDLVTKSVPTLRVRKLNFLDERWDEMRAICLHFAQLSRCWSRIIRNEFTKSCHFADWQFQWLWEPNFSIVDFFWIFVVSSRYEFPQKQILFSTMVLAW